mmetsp:Transcript_65308/g.147318  ORF Transcript_65308/g.147318 Transcript_65308/m.147318 type:complete len:112 (-) Transcript_65308:173-508(-)
MLLSMLEEFGLGYVIKLFTLFGQTFYYEFRMAVVIWLMFFDGAVFIFEKAIEPLMKEYQAEIDAAFEKVSDMAEDAKQEAVSDPDGFIQKHGQAAYSVAKKQIEEAKKKLS